MAGISERAHLVASPAIAAAWVLSLYGASAVPLDDLWRPLAIAIGAALLIEALWVLLLGGVWGALLSIVGVALLLALWPLGAAVAALGIWWIAVNRLRASRSAAPPPRARLRRLLGGLGTVSLVFLGITIASAAPNLALGRRTIGPPIAAPATSGPNMYLVLLDGYPRADTLVGDFGVDNGPFLEALETRGFDVASASRSNYSKTWVTLNSILYMRYADEIDALMPFPSDPIEQHRRLLRALDDAPVLDWFAESGYTLTWIASPFVDAAARDVHEFVDTGQLNSFEVGLLRNSLLTDAVGWLAPQFVTDQLRDRIRSAFALTAQYAAQPGSGPRLVLTHVMSPHPPFLYGGRGEELGTPACFPSRCGLWDAESGEMGITPVAYEAAMGSQLTVLNAQLLELVDVIVGNDPQAVVILFSDHGSRHDRDNGEEFLRNFFAARTPGRVDVFPDQVHLVNLFPHLLGAYFGTDFAVAEYAGWISRGAPLNLERFDAAAPAQSGNADASP